MDRPWWLLPQPPFNQTTEMLTAFEHVFSDLRTEPGGQSIVYQLSYPKWQFLSYIGQAKDVVLHGSFRPDINKIEPRQANDIRAFSAQRAIYATTDGIWAIFFAILDRQRYPMGLHNTCLQIRDGSDQFSEPLYFFSITRSALDQQPWCNGAVYILPRESFEQEPVLKIEGAEILVPHWVGKKPIRPVSRLIVGPADFPFLGQIRGHDDQRLLERARADPNSFPWLDERE